ncbi:MAG TPA: hypothetical protein VMP03_01215, partial [Methylomirabilota bacterium]|nr:hypothetical protein [Methylomirabilota bacterium]
MPCAMPVRLALAAVLASAVLLGASGGAVAAEKLKNTGILLDKVAHEAGRLVVSGKTPRAGQTVRFGALGSKRSRANRTFAYRATAEPGACTLVLQLNGRKDKVTVTGCGPKGAKGADGKPGPAGADGTPGAFAFRGPFAADA